MPRSKSKSKRKPKRPQTAIPYIDSPESLAPVAEKLAESSLIAFDTEFLWERTYSPKLGLIQVADAESTWLVDPLALSAKDMEPLLDVLVSPDTLKVGHAVEQDQICLYRNYGIVANPTLDTSVAAALTGMGAQIGLSTLISKLLRIPLDKGYSRTNWLKRPLTPKMLKYAADDVAHLCRAANLLLDRLAKLDRKDWALELSGKAGEVAMAHFDPKSVARKLAVARRLNARTYAILRELIAWREKDADRRDMPRRWLAEDKTLVKLAVACPTTREELGDFRGLSGVNRPKSAGLILAAIKRGLKSAPDGYKLSPRRKGPTSRESAALVVLRCFLNTLAAANDIPVRLLVSDEEMVALLRAKLQNVEGLRGAGILEGRVVDLIGEDLVEILNGRRGLRIVNGQAALIDS